MTITTTTRATPSANNSLFIPPKTEDINAQRKTQSTYGRASGTHLPPTHPLPNQHSLSPEHLTVLDVARITVKIAKSARTMPSATPSFPIADMSAHKSN
ncbi:MAG: hypothetical protein KGL39_10540 [Patescibacteria group bacterium]|nr:hypothetical protein [Patescibacteria group bacterium]